MDFWKTLKGSTPVFPDDIGAVICVSSNSSLKDAFLVLINHNLLSVPVREFGETHSPFIGFFTMLDLVVHVLGHISDLEFPEGDANAFSMLLTEREQFLGHRVKDLIGMGGEPYVCVEENEPVDRLARTMVVRHAHRAVVLRKNGELVNVITQSRLVQCVNELWGIDPSLATIGERLIGEMHLGSKDVISITEDRPALEAFKLMRDSGVSGIAVVRGKKLVGNISLHDLNMVKETGFYLRLLYAPISEYLDNVAARGHPFRELIKCTPQDKFSTAVDRMVSSKVHRIYIVNDDASDRLIGIITLTDVLRVVVDQEIFEKGGAPDVNPTTTVAAAARS